MFSPTNPIPLQCFLYLFDVFDRTEDTIGSIWLKINIDMTQVSHMLGPYQHALLSLSLVDMCCSQVRFLPTRPQVAKQTHLRGQYCIPYQKCTSSNQRLIQPEGTGEYPAICRLGDTVGRRVAGTIRLLVVAVFDELLWVWINVRQVRFMFFCKHVVVWHESHQVNQCSAQFKATLFVLHSCSNMC